MKKEVIGLLVAALPFMLIMLSFSAYAEEPYEITDLQPSNWCEGQWQDCSNAFEYDEVYSTASRSRTLGFWRQFHFSADEGGRIENVEMIVAISPEKRSYIKAGVSGDGGRTYGPTHIISRDLYSPVTYIDVTNDAIWTPQNINNDKIVVNLTCIMKKRFSWWPPPWLEHFFRTKCNVDWIAMNITYIDKFNFSISLDPDTTEASRITGQNETNVTVIVSLLSGNPHFVSLSHEGCPLGVQCGFMEDSVIPSGTSLFTIKVEPIAPLRQHLINITGRSMGKTRMAVLNFTINP